MWAFVAVGGAPAGERVFGTFPAEPPRAAVALGPLSPVPARLRICTYNIQNFEDGLNDGPGRTPAVARRHARLAAELIEKVAPEIVVLQEIENEQALRFLNAAFRRPFPIGYVTDFAPRPDGQPEKLNLAVLSRVPIFALRELDFAGLEGTNRPPRGALSFCVSLGGRHVLMVYVVHLKSNWGDAERNRALRRRALALLRRDLEAVRAGDPNTVWETLVVGDMNVDPRAPGFEDDPTLEPFADWADLWRGRAPAEQVTVPARKGPSGETFPPAAFDRFIASRELAAPPWVAGLPRALQEGVDVQDGSARPGQGLSHVSDHYPVYLDIFRDL